MLKPRTPNDGVELFVVQVKIPAGPVLGIRRNQSRRVLNDTQIGKPSKAKTLRHTRSHAFETVVIVGRLNGVNKLLK